jgi:hypothetical protein
MVHRLIYFGVGAVFVSGLCFGQPLACVAAIVILVAKMALDTQP